MAPEPELARSTEAAILQAKGHHYTLDALLAGGADAWSPRFEDGQFATIYLAPYNYHRIHMPVDGTPEGSLVCARPAVQRQRRDGGTRCPACSHATSGWCCCSRARLRAVRRDFRRRTECRQHGHGLAWRRHAAPSASHYAVCRCRRRPTAFAPAGAEIGRFNMGSTVVLLFGTDRVALEQHLAPRRHRAPGSGNSAA